MTKGKSNVFAAAFLLFALLAFSGIQAQVEVVPLPEDEREVLFDSIHKQKITPVQERKIPDSVLKKLQQDEAFWYANYHFEKKATVQKNNTNRISWLQQQWVRQLFWFVVIGLFASLLIWYLSTLNIRLFRRSPVDISSLPGAPVTEDIFSISYEQEISKAVAAGNYRQAIRLHYLQTLRLLSNKDLIKYKQDRTNSEYLVQLYPTHFYKSFFKLTRHFEYTWYGKFDINAAAFEMVQKDFETFYSKVNS